MRASAAPSLLSALTGRPGVSAAVLLATAALSAVLPMARQQDPEARATLLLREPAVAEVGGDTDGRAYVRAQASVARLPLIAVLTTYATDAVHPAAGIDLGEVQQGLRVGLAPGETGLVFRVRHADPEVAQYAADAAAYSYQRVRRARLRAEAAAAVARLDAVDRSLRALPPGRDTERAREDVARQRAAALVQRTEPDLGIVANVPAELDDTRVRRPVAVASGLLAGLVPALLLGHLLQVRTAGRNARGLAAGTRRLGTLRIGRGASYDVAAALLPGGAGRTAVVAVVATDPTPRCAAAARELAEAARALGRRVQVSDAGTAAGAGAPDADLVLVPVTGTFARGRALEGLLRAETAVVVTPAGTRRTAALAVAQEQLAAVQLPVLVELVVGRRWPLSTPRRPGRRSPLRRPLPVAAS